MSLSNMNPYSMAMAKEFYISPTSESLELHQETVICGSFDGTDNTEIIGIDDEVVFGLPSIF